MDEVKALLSQMSADLQSVKTQLQETPPGAEERDAVLRGEASEHTPGDKERDA